MKNKCTVIQISGLRGLLIVGFIIMCAAAGFIVFPSWCCMQLWNFIAASVINMPVMTLKHGALLWLIIVLISYATLFNKFRIAFVPHSGKVYEDGFKEEAEIVEALEARHAESVQSQEEKEEIKK